MKSIRPVRHGKRAHLKLEKLDSDFRDDAAANGDSKNKDTDSGGSPINHSNVSTQPIRISNDGMKMVNEPLERSPQPHSLAEPLQAPFMLPYGALTKNTSWDSFGTGNSVSEVTWGPLWVNGVGSYNSTGSYQPFGEVEEDLFESKRHASMSDKGGSPVHKMNLILSLTPPQYSDVNITLSTIHTRDEGRSLVRTHEDSTSNGDALTALLQPEPHSHPPSRTVGSCSGSEKVNYSLASSRDSDENLELYVVTTDSWEKLEHASLETRRNHDQKNASESFLGRHNVAPTPSPTASKISSSSGNTSRPPITPNSVSVKRNSNSRRSFPYPPPVAPPPSVPMIMNLMPRNEPLPDFNDPTYKEHKRLIRKLIFESSDMVRIYMSIHPIHF